MSVCPATVSVNFPHHWKCIYDKGHPITNCLSDCKGFCSAIECSLADGTRRFPDGSISFRDHLQAGGTAIAKHNLVSGEVEKVKIPLNLNQ